MVQATLHPPMLCRMPLKVICAVYGPHAQTGRDSAFSEEGQLQCEFSYAPFATPGGRRESRGGKTNDERELSTLLRQTLESSVQVNSAQTKYWVMLHLESNFPLLRCFFQLPPSAHRHSQNIAKYLPTIARGAREVTIQ